jgi:antitoxin VapB
MALNIKNPDADRLARELAELTGLCITDALVLAILEKLDRERARGNATRRVRDISRIRERFNALPLHDTRHADDIIGYDKDGLPS